ncbi:RNA methyltransferase [Rhodovastum atsumiense]|nr:RNA methyltransferase [Rhodovastum atsumiense]CAH2600973.1 RNA methyltransferase [Rhodovastum atsumiense]
MKPDTICGANAVDALFARRPDDVIRLFYATERRDLVGPWCSRLAEARRPYRLLPDAELVKVAGTPHHGGVVAVAKPREIPLLDLRAPPRGNFLLVLDGIGNPHNLGAIARSAAWFGVPALLLHDIPGAALPSDAAYRTAEGGLEWLALHRTRDLPRALAALAPYYRIVATTLAADAVPPEAIPRDRPLALVLGAEEHGIRAEVLAACRRSVRIRGTGRVQSLNVAQAAAVLLHALT